MISRPIARLALATLILAGVVTACNDHDTVVAPPSFQVVLEVTNADGRPVPGLELGMAPDTPYYLDGTSRFHSAAPAEEQLKRPFPNPSSGIEIPFHLDVTSQVSLIVEDIEGNAVRTLLDGQMDSGERIAFWNGHDDSGALSPSGVYTAHLVVRDPDSQAVRLDDSQPMLLAVFDQMKLGPTDAKGRIVLRDKRLLPFLYDIPDMPATDATGAIVGTISLSPTVRFYFTDPGTGYIRRYDRNVEGPATLSFVWNPPPAAN